MSGSRETANRASGKMVGFIAPQIAMIIQSVKANLWEGGSVVLDNTDPVKF
jgi:hypothetical protein